MKLINYFPFKFLICRQTRLRVYADMNKSILVSYKAGRAPTPVVLSALARMLSTAITASVKLQTLRKRLSPVWEYFQHNALVDKSKCTVVVGSGVYGMQIKWKIIKRLKLK